MAPKEKGGPSAEEMGIKPEEKMTLEALEGKVTLLRSISREAKRHAIDTHNALFSRDTDEDQLHAAYREESEASRELEEAKKALEAALRDAK